MDMEGIGYIRSLSLYYYGYNEYDCTEPDQCRICEEKQAYTGNTAQCGKDLQKIQPFIAIISHPSQQGRHYCDQDVCKTDRKRIKGRIGNVKIKNIDVLRGYCKIVNWEYGRRNNQ